MSRFDRPAFNAAELAAQPHDEARNRLLFDWWCDEGDPHRTGNPRPSDRLLYISSLQAKPPGFFPSRAPLQNDPAPPLNQPAPQGFRNVYLLVKPFDIHKALTESHNFSNIPYAALGGASFLLGLDPGSGYGGKDWHAQQQALVKAALAGYNATGLRVLARLAVEQAALAGLARPEFDLAQFTEQAALRYMGLLFGYSFQDHPLLEDAARATYRALQYLAVGQHFVTEPGTLPAAQQALGRLVDRTSQLMEEYTRLARSPRRYGWEPGRDWPEGVVPWSELGLRLPLGEPLLKRLPTLGEPRIPNYPPKPFDLLSGRDRATVAATLIAGTLGNIQSAVCLLTQSLLNGPDADRWLVRNETDDGTLENRLAYRMAKLPPVPVLPRRTKAKRSVVLSNGTVIPPETDCLLLLEGQTVCPHPPAAHAYPLVWGEVPGPPVAPHACLGRDLSMPLIAALVRYTLRLPGLKAVLDPLTGSALQAERLWGFACTRYPLRFERERMRVQQNLIVSMRVKPPISENAMRLRRLITAGIPRIDHVLRGFGHLHFAWFEFSDDDTRLVLRTIYDGQFEPYVEHFALEAGDLFDRLFDYLEDPPTRPVAEHPQDFVETLRRHNRAPLAGYLFSAYPGTEAEQIRSCAAPSP